MLLSIMTLTAIYKLLPENKQTPSIRVGVYCSYENEYIDDIYLCLEDVNSLYEFYPATDFDSLLDDVKSGYAECGFYIPDNFFEDYIVGNYENQATMYNTPSATLSQAICETFFSCILKVCAPEILTEAVDSPEYNNELTEGIKAYLNSDTIFTIESLTEGEYSFQEETYKVNIPVYEISLLLIIFSGLLGLLVYMQDYEKNIYIALNKKEVSLIKFTSILTAVIPISLTGIICLLIIGSFANLVKLLIFSLASIFIAMILSLLIRKSTHLLKVLPLIMLVSIIVIFINGLI